mmetsp:Transcript_17266/g.43032  ORF Transcript_17266/g.43032 Transcript_17266/m.43032 type:complete len:348 (-) Transcript_17266:6-1049(-)
MAEQYHRGVESGVRHVQVDLVKPELDEDDIDTHSITSQLSLLLDEGPPPLKKEAKVLDAALKELEAVTEENKKLEASIKALQDECKDLRIPSSSLTAMKNEYKLLQARLEEQKEVVAEKRREVKAVEEVNRSKLESVRMMTSKLREAEELAIEADTTGVLRKTQQLDLAAAELEKKEVQYVSAGERLRAELGELHLQADEVMKALEEEKRLAREDDERPLTSELVESLRREIEQAERMKVEAMQIRKQIEEESERYRETCVEVEALDAQLEEKRLAEVQRLRQSSTSMYAPTQKLVDISDVSETKSEDAISAPLPGTDGKQAKDAKKDAKAKMRRFGSFTFGKKGKK